MKELLTYLINSLVVNHDQVEITEEQKGDRVTFKVRVAKEDMGRIIGKEGRTAKSIRMLVGAAASKQNLHTRVDILED